MMQNVKGIKNGLSHCYTDGYMRCYYTSYKAPKDFSLFARVVGRPSWPDSDLKRTTAVHLVERGLVVLQLEDVRDLITGYEHAQVGRETGQRTMPLTLIFPPSRYATARGKQ